MSKYFHFGKYLVDKGLLDMSAVITARMVQQKNNLKIGQLAKAKGLLTDKEILQILIIQEKTMEKFGEIAVQEGYLTKKQRQNLLEEQADLYMHFGESLALIGVMTEEEVIEHLKEFNRLKQLCLNGGMIKNGQPSFGRSEKAQEISV